MSHVSRILRSLDQEAVMHVLLAVVICAVMPAWASAQTAPPALPDSDAIVSIGWGGAEHDRRDQVGWQSSVLVGLRGGHYWTDHVKTEIEASWSSPGTHQLYDNIERDGGYTYVISDYQSHDVRVGFAQLYQFGRNQWVHPYVGVGADVVRRAATIDRQPQSRTIFLQNRSMPIDFPALNERATKVFAQAVLKTGVKMYVAEKVFFDTELKFGFRRDVDHLVWKLGMGVDF
jgi:hypothetical protein